MLISQIRVGGQERLAEITIAARKEMHKHPTSYPVVTTTTSSSSSAVYDNECNLCVFCGTVQQFNNAFVSLPCLVAIWNCFQMQPLTFSSINSGVGRSLGWLVGWLECLCFGDTQFRLLLFQLPKVAMFHTYYPKSEQPAHAAPVV